jgi:hypothetical protein
LQLVTKTENPVRSTTEQKGASFIGSGEAKEKREVRKSFKLLKH